MLLFTKLQDSSPHYNTDLHWRDVLSLWTEERAWPRHDALLCQIWPPVSVSKDPPTAGAACAAATVLQQTDREGERGDIRSGTVGGM